ncbi:MAG TPA: preprotein translocase subunit SecG [Methylocella sp.]|nr:preprotein translocase subunit SecG [Methylocella sp.]
MQSVLIVVHLMIVVALVVTVLLQRSEGGALGVGGGGGFMTGRGQANALTRATAILAALFFATSLGLTILARFNQAPEVIFQSVTPIEPQGGAAKEGEGKGSLLDQLKQLEDQTSKPGQAEPAEQKPGRSILETAPATPPSPVMPALPPPAKPMPLPVAPPQPGHSLLETSPSLQQSLTVPPQPQPAAAPLSQAGTPPASAAAADPAPAAPPTAVDPAPSSPAAQPHSASTHSRHHKHH